MINAKVLYAATLAIALLASAAAMADIEQGSQPVQLCTTGQNATVR